MPRAAGQRRPAHLEDHGVHYPAVRIEEREIDAGRAPAASPLSMCPLSIFSVTLLDLAALMDEIQAIIDRVAMAVEFVFGFALLSGLLVLFAAVHATLDDRLRESAVLRTLGAGRGVVARGWPRSSWRSA